MNIYLPTDYPDYKDLLIKNDSYSSEIQELIKYKNAWEELREDNQLPIPFIELLSELMQNLEQKHGIEVSNE